MTMTPPSEFGTLTVISGCMFAEKSSKLIRILKRAQYEKKQVVAIKPSIDGRYSGTDIVSHSGFKFMAISVTHPNDILRVAGIQEAQVIGIDEAQFFDESIVGVCRELVSQGKGVVIAGLDLDFRGHPFGSMPTLLATADFVTKLHAACVVCGGIATRSQRIVNSQEQIVVGDSSAYEARCRKHWSPEPVFARGGGRADD